MRHLYSHDRISAISGIAVSPVRFHCSLYCQLWEEVIQGEEVAFFLRHLLQQIRGHLFVLLDNSRIHRGDPVKQFLARTHRLHLVSFPAYAPELNPDEGVWNHLKQRLANGRTGLKFESMDELLRGRPAYDAPVAWGSPRRIPEIYHRLRQIPSAASSVNRIFPFFDQDVALLMRRSINMNFSVFYLCQYLGSRSYCGSFTLQA